MNLAENLIQYFKSLPADWPIPQGFQWLYPYGNPEAISCIESFYTKYYNDSNNRTLLLGINPGRFGAGITGIAFTDPKILQERCDISNSFLKKHELSSIFVYEFIEAYGGIDTFYNHFLISSVCPLGFTHNGINCNYYDDKDLYNSVKPLIIKSLWNQIEMGINRDVAYSLGKGTNLKYLKALNEQEKFFKKIVPLPHPRWVMQYRRKEKEKHLDYIVSQLNQA